MIDVLSVNILRHALYSVINLIHLNGVLDRREEVTLNNNMSSRCYGHSILHISVNSIIVMYCSMRVSFLTSILFASFCSMMDSRYVLYSSDGLSGAYPGYDCLYARIYGKTFSSVAPFINSYQLLPFCRRSEHDEESEQLESGIGVEYRFDDLKRRGVTSHQLLQWLATIDTAERYERYDWAPHEVFYNCTPPWFGLRCQYMFDYTTTPNFADIVNQTFFNRRQYGSRFTGFETCYPFLSTCYRGAFNNCLDWREICNGISDCYNGEDEQFCDRLELHHCDPDQYRCHYGGQCIPLIFQEDGARITDCLDGSDEMAERTSPSFQLYRLDCHEFPTFSCEETISRLQHSVSCGNGTTWCFQMRFEA
jgi:hypothetical protein